MDMIKMLQNVPLFAEMNEGELKSIASLASSIEVKKKNIIVQESDPGDSMYIILAGDVKISTYSADGREIVLALLDEGSFFGEMSLLDTEPRSANATTMTDATLAHIRRCDLLPLLKTQPEITFKLLQEATARLRRTSRMLERITSMDVAHRLYAYIVEHCRRFGYPSKNGRYATILPTHQLLADQLSTSRETVSRSISKLKMDGILIQGNKRGQMSVDVDTLEDYIDAC